MRAQIELVDSAARPERRERLFIGLPVAAAVKRRLSCRAPSTPEDDNIRRSPFEPCRQNGRPPANATNIVGSRSGSPPRISGRQFSGTVRSALCWRCREQAPLCQRNCLNRHAALENQARLRIPPTGAGFSPIRLGMFEPCALVVNGKHVRSEHSASANNPSSSNRRDAKPTPQRTTVRYRANLIEVWLLPSAARVPGRAPRPPSRRERRASSPRCWCRCRPTVRPRIVTAALVPTMGLTMPNRSKVLLRARRRHGHTSPGASLSSIRLSSRRSGRAPVTFSR